MTSAPSQPDIFQQAATYLAGFAPLVQQHGQIDDCLHCSIAGNGPWAKAMGITYATYDKSLHQPIIDACCDIAKDESARLAFGQKHGVYPFWLYGPKLVLAPTAHPSLEQATATMAQMIHSNELWKQRGRGPEPETPAFPQAVAFLKERWPAHPEWAGSLVAQVII